MLNLNIFLSLFLQFSRTMGFVPQPSISSHLPSFEQISTSADGSVKGKYEGLKRIFNSLQRREIKILLIKSFKFANVMFSSTRIPSIWWNIGRCVASSSFLYTFPAEI